MIIELIKELEDLEQKDFYLEMNDHWSNDDYALHRNYRNQINSLLAKIRTFIEEGSEMTIDKIRELYEKGYEFEINDGKIVSVIDKDGVRVDGI